MGWSPQYYIPSFVEIHPPVLEKKTFQVCFFFAHLSRRLTGELIRERNVYTHAPASARHPKETYIPMLRRPSVRRPQFQRSSPLKPLGQSKPNFMWKGTSRQRSGKGAIRKRFPLQKPRWEKTKLTIRYLYHETYRKPNEQLFSQ